MAIPNACTKKRVLGTHRLRSTLVLGYLKIILSAPSFVSCCDYRPEEDET